MCPLFRLVPIAAALIATASGAGTEKHVRLLHIADTHAQLETHPEYMPGEQPDLRRMGGYARLKNALDRERDVANKAVFLVDGGDIHEGDLWNLLPLDSRLKMGWGTGKELREYLEAELELVYSSNPIALSGGWGPRASGLTFTFAARAAKGERVQAVKVGGKEVEDAAHYTFAGCEREGEPMDVVCRHRDTHDVKVLPLTIHEAMPLYFNAHPVIAPRREKRAVATDLPDCVFSQDTMLSGKGGTKGKIEPDDPFLKPAGVSTPKPK